MQVHSNCCNADLVPGTHIEAPLGGMHTISYKTDVCDKCGQEADPVECCDNCGEPADEFRTTELGDYCKRCFTAEYVRRVEQLRREWGAEGA